MTEDPTPAAEALAVPSLPAVAAAAAGGDARDEHAVAHLPAGDRGTNLFDRPDRFVAEDAAALDGGDVTLENVQVGPADRYRIDPDHRVGGGRDDGSGPVLLGRATGAGEHCCLHHVSLVEYGDQAFSGPP